jgi:hypothetical protein
MKIITDNGFVVYEVLLKLMVELQSSVTTFHYSSVVTDGIPRTNVPGLYIAFFQDYLLLCSYVLCAEIYFSITSQPEPTEPW